MRKAFADHLLLVIDGDVKTMGETKTPLKFSFRAPLNFSLCSN